MLDYLHICLTGFLDSIFINRQFMLIFSILCLEEFSYLHVRGGLNYEKKSFCFKFAAFGGIKLTSNLL